MNHYKVCVYAISKNESKFVDKWVNSMNEADLIVVADTGSTDDTVEQLKNLGVTVYNITVDPWRFDTARNLSMDFVPEDIDICVCTDLDEVFDPGWREKLEAAWKPETTRLRYNYTFGFNPDGSPIVTFLYEKIHKRQNFRWIYPVHEILDYSGQDPDCYAIEREIHLKHYPDPAKSRSNYLKLLELSAKDFPLYDRNIHYLGREYMFHEKYEEAIKTLIYHLSLPNATWKDERCASMRFLARCYTAKQQLEEAKSWLLKAIAEASHVRESYVELAKLGYMQQDWPLVFFCVTTALKSTYRTGSYLDQESSWGPILYDYGAIACYQLGMYESAYTLAQEAVEKDPTDPRLQVNLKLIASKLNLPSKDGDNDDNH